MTTENKGGGEDGPTDVLGVFPAWQPAASEEHTTQTTPQAAVDEPQAPRLTRAASRQLKSTASLASSGQSAAALPVQQQQQLRPKRFNLRDGAREAITTMREEAQAKHIVVAEPLYAFYNTEISLHFLHAMSAYFIRVAKDLSLERRQQGQPFPPQTRAAVDREEEGRGDGGRERAALLREAGRSYGRVIVYCSNFESTAADAMFFESLLRLARMVVASAVAEPSLASEIDKEFDRILRGGVFHPTLVGPARRPHTRPRRSPRRQQPRDGPHRSWGGFRTPENGLESAEGERNGSGRDPVNRRGVREAGGFLCAFPGSTRGDGGRDFLGSGGKKRRGRHAGPAIEPGPSRGSAGLVSSSTTPPTRPSSSRQLAGWAGGGAGGLVAGAATTPPRTSSRRGRAGPSVSPGRHDAGGGGTRGAVFVAGRGGSNPSLRGGSPKAKAGAGGAEEEDGAAAATFPAFDELSRWKVTRSSVPRMVRLAGEAQRVALSNLALAEEYRRALATELREKMSSALPTTSATASCAIDQTATPSRPDQTPLSLAAAAAAGKKAPVWKRRGRTLTPRSQPSGGVRPAADNRNDGKEFFCAEALSVCIGSVVGS